MRAAFIDIDGTRTRYLYEGDKDETLLLVHGFGLSADIWAHVLDPLAAHFTVYAPDILGHGFTDFKDPGADAAPLVMTRHLEGFMDAVGIGRCAVLGSSLGGCWRRCSTPRGPRASRRSSSTACTRRSRTPASCRRRRSAPPWPTAPRR